MKARTWILEKNWRWDIRVGRQVNGLEVGSLQRTNEHPQSSFHALFA